jgi:hypothetical protein
MGIQKKNWQILILICLLVLGHICLQFMLQDKLPDNLLWSRDDSEIVNVSMAALVLDLDRRRKGKRIVAMALYGNQSRYVYGALENAVLYQRDWRALGWTLRIYYDETVPEPIIKQLSDLQVEVTKVSSHTGGHTGMFWRFYVLEDRSVSRFIVRDADARLSYRDLMAVQEWAESDYLFHCLHDHPLHNTPILGGMWGAIGGAINPKAIEDWRKKNQTASVSDDQIWLANTLWSHIKNYTLVHASFLCGLYQEAEYRGFPTKRASPSDFVGNIFSPEDGFHGLQLHEECPPACRRHPEWSTC